ncbi:hypothetical protein VHEMI04372 [[Torrubiella] hemipterigena]|uniref:Peptidase S53 domain-containing protein n=1 Tax=[Torrubiella] hemipterigena TaxID=1531966 RepID=A0A0A1TG36_9HYPO|nr:hypothetical protein VHEMI04372 [[Torrubiella] hemipterigena]
MLPTLYTLLALAATASAAPSLDVTIHKLLGAPTILEKVAAPGSWQTVGKPSPETTMTLQIALKQGNIQGLHAKLNDISDHNSPNYGKWLSKEEIKAFTAPKDDDAEKVHQWLRAIGVSQDAISQPSPDWIHIELPVHKAEELLKTEYSIFKHDATGRTMARALQYSVPKSLHSVIDTIQPTVSFVYNQQAQAVKAIPASSALPATNASNSDCTKNFTPSCVRKLYNVDYKGTGKSSIAAFLANGDDAVHTDMPLFLSRNDPTTPNTTDYQDYYIGKKITPDADNAEPSLDIQLQVSLAYPNPAGIFHIGPSGDFYDELLAFTNFLNTNKTTPHVVSLSYASAEHDTANQYTTRVCDEFAKATARGITIITSSGDYGVGALDSYCTGSFRPTYPAGCPWLTSVGGTELTADGSKEVAANFSLLDRGSSGGGFSNLYGVPDWQSADTAAYIKTIPDTYEGKYNKSGRGIPDVAMIGTPIPIVYKGDDYQAQGTSASTPIFAALITQINDYRIANGKSALGFINKRLYTDKTVRAAFRDITSGSNPNCGTGGFNATKGWDPVTGLGSIDFAALRKAFAA